MERTLLFALAAGVLVRSLPLVAALFCGTALLGAGIAMGNVLLPVLVKREFPNSPGLMTSAYVIAIGLAAAFAAGVVVPLSTGPRPDGPRPRVLAPTGTDRGSLVVAPGGAFAEEDPAHIDGNCDVSRHWNSSNLRIVGSGYFFLGVGPGGLPVGW